MKQAWIDDQLTRIKNGTSIFGHIPAEIGRVVYCDSTHGKAKGILTITTGQITSICIGVGSVLVALLLIKFLPNIMGIILILGCSIFCFYEGFHEMRFRGNDYFVGEKGFSKVTFMRSRGSIKTEETVPFDSIAYLCVSENEVWSPGKHSNYLHTTCVYTFYGVDPDNSKAAKLISIEGEFFDRQAHFADNPALPNEDYLFLRKVEEVWTRLFLSKVADDDVINFPWIDEDGNAHPCVSVYPWGLRVREGCKAAIDLFFDEIVGVKLGENNTLAIERVNYAQRPGGAFTTIDYSRLANGKALLSLICGKAKYVTPL